MRFTGNRLDGLEGIRLQAEGNDGTRLIVIISREAFGDYGLEDCKSKAIDKYIAGLIEPNATVTVTTSDFT